MRTAQGLARLALAENGPNTRGFGAFRAIEIALQDSTRTRPEQTYLLGVAATFNPQLRILEKPAYAGEL